VDRQAEAATSGEGSFFSGLKVNGSGSPRRSCRRGPRKTPKVTEVLPLIYLHGLSTSDFGPALGQFLGSSHGLSAPVIAKLTETWQAGQRTFAGRELSGVEVRLHLGRRGARQRPAAG
jgi:hypothetical protein